MFKVITLAGDCIANECIQRFSVSDTKKEKYETSMVVGAHESFFDAISSCSFSWLATTPPTTSIACILCVSILLSNCNKPATAWLFFLIFLYTHTHITIIRLAAILPMLAVGIFSGSEHGLTFFAMLHLQHNMPLVWWTPSYNIQTILGTIEWVM